MNLKTKAIVGETALTLAVGGEVPQVNGSLTPILDLR